MTGLTLNAPVMERGEATAAPPRFVPFGLRILVLPDAPETKTKGGIHKPDVALEREGKGTVVAMGSGAFHPQHGKEVRPGDYFHPGQRLIYSKYAGTEVTIDEVPHVVITPDDVLMAGE